MARIHIERPIHKKSVAPMRDFLRKLSHEFRQLETYDPVRLHATLALTHANIDITKIADITRKRPDSAEAEQRALVDSLRYVGQTAVSSSVALELYDDSYGDARGLFDESRYYKEAFDQYDPTATYLPHITIGKMLINNTKDIALLRDMQEWSGNHAPSEIILAPVRTRVNLSCTPRANPTVTKTAS